MIANNNELYTAVEELSNTLHAAGYDKSSKALTDELTISSAPGEILGGIRFQLQQLEISRLPNLLGVKRPSR